MLYCLQAFQRITIMDPSNTIKVGPNVRGAELFDDWLKLTAAVQIRLQKLAIMGRKPCKFGRYCPMNHVMLCGDPRTETETEPWCHCFDCPQKDTKGACYRCEGHDAIIDAVFDSPCGHDHVRAPMVAPASPAVLGTIPATITVEERKRLESRIDELLGEVTGLEKQLGKITSEKTLALEASRCSLEEAKKVNQNMTAIIAEHKKCATRITDLTRDLAAAEAEKSTLSGRVRTLEGQIRILEADVKSYSDQVGHARLDKVKMDGQLATANAQIAKLQETIDGSEKQIALLRNSKAKKRVDGSAKVSISLDTLTAKDARIAELEKLLATSEESNRAMKAAKDGIAEDNARLSEENTRLSAELAEAKAAYEEMQQALLELYGPRDVTLHQLPKPRHTLNAFGMCVYTHQRNATATVNSEPVNVELRCAAAAYEKHKCLTHLHERTSGQRKCSYEYPLLSPAHPDLSFPFRPCCGNPVAAGPKNGKRSYLCEEHFKLVQAEAAAKSAANAERRAKLAGGPPGAARKLTYSEPHDEPEEPHDGSDSDEPEVSGEPGVGTPSADPTMPGPTHTSVAHSGLALPDATRVVSKEATPPRPLSHHAIRYPPGVHTVGGAPGTAPLRRKSVLAKAGELLGFGST